MEPMPKVELGRPATYEDLVAVPDHLVAEIVDGELWTSPRPAPRHTLAHSRLMSRLGSTLGGDGDDGPGGWWILLEPELHLGTNALVPDIAGWRRERMPRLPETAYFPLPPDWVCEVISPSTGVLDRAKKLRVYAEHGVAHTWIVDPILRTLEVLRRNAAGEWVVAAAYGGAVTLRAEPFGAIDLHLATLWEDGA